MKDTNILLGELTRSKNNNNVEDKILNQSCSSISDDDGDDDLNDLVMSEPTNSKSSIVGQFVGVCNSFQCDFVFSS